MSQLGHSEIKEIWISDYIEKPFNHFDFYNFISIIYFGPNALNEHFDVILLQILLMMPLLLW